MARLTRMRFMHYCHEPLDQGFSSLPALPRLHKRNSTCSGNRFVKASRLLNEHCCPPICKFSANRRQGAKRRSALRFQVKADGLRSITDIEFAKQIPQMKFDRVDRHAKFPRQLSIAATKLQCSQQIAFPVGQACQGIGRTLCISTKGNTISPAATAANTSSSRSGGESFVTKPAPPSRNVSAGAAASLVPL